MLDKLFFKYEDYEIVNYTEDNTINIYLKSKLKTCKCHKCGMISNSYHSTYTRRIQDTPIHNTETWLNVSAYEFVCLNDKCDVKTFTEELPFARKNKVKTDALIQFILSISIFLSSTSASLILSLLGAKASSDSIDDLIKNIEIKDNPDIEEIGIDDVAIRKGQEYATAIYDMKNHSLLALFEGRDADSVKEWLKGHKKIKVVARDRASSYAMAISEILPECIQVADRFHLFENLIKHLKDIFYEEMPEKIFIKNNEIVDKKEVNKIPITKNINMEELNKFNYDNSVPVDENGNEINFDNKLHQLSSKQYKEQTERRIKKYNMIKQLRIEIKNVNCHGKKALAEKYEISYAALLKYIKMSDEEVENIAIRRDYKKRKTVMDDFINILYKMIIDNISPEYIIAYIQSKGYKGTEDNLKKYIITITKNNNLNYDYSKLVFIKYVYPDDITVITRRDILKHILTIDERKKNKDIEKYMNLIIDKYPIVGTTKEIFMNFHKTIFSKDEELLDVFIEKHKDTIPSFCNGLKKDIAAVKNAISYSINSGFVEGNNNKFKLIKRIVYGKQKICNLFKKSFLAFAATLDNFCIEEIVEGVLNNKK